MRGIALGITLLLGAFVGSCGQCPTPTCNPLTLDPFLYCIEDQNCSIDGQVITSCRIGGGLDCRLWQLQPGETLSIPVDRMWRDAKSAHDLEITEQRNKQLDLNLISVSLDDKPVTCDVLSGYVLCKGLDPTTHVMKFRHGGPGATSYLELSLSDKSCKPAPCPV